MRLRFLYRNFFIDLSMRPTILLIMIIRYQPLTLPQIQKSFSFIFDGHTKREILSTREQSQYGKGISGYSTVVKMLNQKTGKTDIAEFFNRNGVASYYFIKNTSME